jgi:hypothetical protein
MLSEVVECHCVQDLTIESLGKRYRVSPFTYRGWLVWSGSPVRGGINNQSFASSIIYPCHRKISEPLDVISKIGVVLTFQTTRNPSSGVYAALDVLEQSLGLGMRVFPCQSLYHCPYTASGKSGN